MGRGFSNLYFTEISKEGGKQEGDDLCGSPRLATPSQGEPAPAYGDRSLCFIVSPP